MKRLSSHFVKTLTVLSSLLGIFCTHTPLALFAQEEITVELKTTRDFATVYLSRFLPDKPLFKQGYLPKLESTLLFDLANNGYMEILPTNDLLETQVKKDLKGTMDQQFWRLQVCDYVIVAEIKGKSLVLQLYLPSTGESQFLRDIHLSGDMEEDQNKIHFAADEILYKTLGKEGIAQSKILYSYQVDDQTSREETWKAEIWEADYTGEHPKQRTFHQAYSITPTPVPNPSNPLRTPFLYVCYLNGQPKIYLSKGIHNSGEAIISLRGNQLLPAISKQGDKIAFVSDASGRASLFLQNFHIDQGVVGKPIQIFVPKTGVVASSSFSPDGSKLAFVSDHEATPKIYIVDLLEAIRSRKSPHIECITKTSRENTAPAWSHDGKKLAYSAKTEGIRQIWIYEIDTEESYPITFSKVNKENPVWAKNDLHLLYNTTTDNFDIFLINLNQKTPIQITHGEGKKHYPSWTTIR